MSSVCSAPRLPRSERLMADRPELLVGRAAVPRTPMQCRAKPACVVFLTLVACVVILTLLSAPATTRSVSAAADTPWADKQGTYRSRALQGGVAGHTSSTLPSMHVFWINLDRDSSRAKKMTEELQKLPTEWKVTRVSASDAAAVGHALATNQLNTAACCRVGDFRADGRAVEQRHAVGEYTLEEGGVLLSHLRTLQMAAETNDDYSLVFEDDVKLPQDFRYRFREYLLAAPADWEILQLHTCNVDQAMHNAQLDVDYIPWFIQSWGTMAYLIRTTTAHKIISRVYQNGNWVLRDNNTFVSDELVYRGLRTFTLTVPFLDRESSSNSHVQPQGTLLIKPGFLGKLVRIAQKRPKPPKQIPSLLILSNTLVKTLEAVDKELNTVRHDYAAIQRHYTKRNLQWKLTWVVRSNTIAATLRGSSLCTGVSNLHCQVVVRLDPYSKWQYVTQHIPIMTKFDLVLIKDADQRLEGFPWLTFLNKMNKSTIASPARQSPLGRQIDGLQTTRQFFQINDATWEWYGRQNEAVKSIIPVARPFIEEYFAVMNGKFAQWFFAHTLQPKFQTRNDGTPEISDWGQDLMWCGAANAWDPEHQACVFVPVTSAHDDTQSTGAWYEDGGRSEVLSAPVRKYEQAFPAWLSYSATFVERCGGQKWSLEENTDYCVSPMTHSQEIGDGNGEQDDAGDEQEDADDKQEVADGDADGDADVDDELAAVRAAVAAALKQEKEEEEAAKRRRSGGGGGGGGGGEGVGDASAKKAALKKEEEEHLSIFLHGDTDRQYNHSQYHGA